MTQSTARNVNGFLESLYTNLKQKDHPKRYLADKAVTLTRAIITYDNLKALITYTTEMEGPVLIPENEGRTFKERHGFIYETDIETNFLNRASFGVVLLEGIKDTLYCVNPEF